MFEKEITFDRFIRGLMIVAGLVFSIYVINRLSMVLLPFFIAWLLAYMIYPTVKFMQYKMKLKSRLLCIILALLLIMACFVGFFWLVIPPAIEEFARFRDIITSVIMETGNSAFALRIESYLQQYFDQNTFVQLLQEKNVMEAVRVAVEQLWNLLSQTIDLIIATLGLCMTLLYLFFILLDYEHLSEGWIKLVPKRNRRFAKELITDVTKGMNSYFRGQALVAFLVGVLFSIGFLIIDFPLAIGLGMFIGFLNLVPYLQAVGFIPTIFLALLKANETGGSFWLILLSACIVFVVVQSIQDTILVPKIMGHIMGLNAAVILLSLSVWGSLLGMIGLIIALPLTNLLLSYYRRFIERDERRVDLAEARRQALKEENVTVETVEAPSPEKETTTGATATLNEEKQENE